MKPADTGRCRDAGVLPRYRVLSHRGEPFVCGSDRRPLRVYHGTGAVFEEFDARYAPGGFWFTDNPGVASRVALSPHARAVGGIANVWMAYLVMRRPVRVRSLRTVSEACDGIQAGTFGADGVIWTNATMVEPGCGPWTQFVVFNPDQVRPFLV